jgi:hypothetical protein
MPRMSARTLLIAVSGISLLGCGGSVGGGGTGPGAFTTGVSGSLPLNRLTSGQATQLCNDVTRANTTTLGPTLCDALNHSGALLSTDAYQREYPTAADAQLQMQCSDILSLMDPSACPAAVTCDAVYLASQPAACTATVADIADCLNGNDALTREWRAATPSCDGLTAASLTAYVAPGGTFDSYANATAMRSASCTALVDCSGIYPINNTSPGS